MEILYVDSDIICSADNMHLLKENALIYSKSSTPFDYLEKLKSVPIIIMVIIRHLFAFGLIIRQFPCYTMSYQNHFIARIWIFGILKDLQCSYMNRYAQLIIQQFYQPMKALGN